MPISNSQTLSEVIPLRLTPADFKRLKRQAEIRERAVAELARIVVRKWLDDIDETNEKEKT